MSPRPDWRVTPDHYQDLSARAHDASYKLLHGMHSINAQAQPGLRDGGPLINGMIAAVIDFALDGDATQADLRQQLVHIIDVMLPQLAMARRSGPYRGGNA